MDERDWLAERFEEHRPRLCAVAYRGPAAVAGQAEESSSWTGSPTRHACDSST
jgi:hypothetical protein